MKMKRFACAALVGACMLSAAGAADLTGGLTPQGAQAYRDTLQSALDRCGQPQIAESGRLQGMWQGVCLARLIDFDGDGTPELYYAGRTEDEPVSQYLFTWQDGKLVQLDIPEGVSNFATDVSPSTLLYVGKDKAYLVDGHEVMNGGTVTYYTKQGNRMVAALTYQDAIGEYPDGSYGAHICTLNGKSVTPEELEKGLSDFTAGMEKQSYSFWKYSSISMSVSGTVGDTVAALRTLTNPKAVASGDRIVLDGKPVQIAVYKMNDNNYFKLRDLAYALSGTDAQFEVKWNGAQQRIDLTDGQAYTPVGGENSALVAPEAQASLTTSAVLLNGRALELTAYQIAGNNFFKLRDLAAALDFGVTLDKQTQSVRIDSSAPYAK